MSLQTLAFNCLACHIMTKQSKLTKNNNPTTTKHKYKIIKTNQLTALVNKIPPLTTKSTSKNHTEK